MAVEPDDAGHHANPLIGPLSADQERLISLLAHTYTDRGQWPPWQFVDETLQRQGIDPVPTLGGLPVVGRRSGIYGLQYGPTWREGNFSVEPQLADRVGLTVAGLHRANMDYLVDVFLRVLRVATAKLLTFQPDPERVVTLEITSAEVIEALRIESGQEPAITEREIYQLLEHEPAMWTGGRGQQGDGSWRWEIARGLRPYAMVRTIEDYIAVVTAAAEESARQVANIIPLVDVMNRDTSETTVTTPTEEQPSPVGPSVIISRPPRYQTYSPEIPLLGSGIDPELWEFVRPLAEAGRWEQVAREAAAFVETRARLWADSSKEVMDLLQDLLAPPKGQQARQSKAEWNELEGWHLLARGFIQAIRNHVMHHSIGTEEELQHGLGALGTASLIVRRIREAVGARAAASYSDPGDAAAQAESQDPSPQQNENETPEESTPLHPGEA